MCGVYIQGMVDMSLVSLFAFTAAYLLWNLKDVIIPAFCTVGVRK